MKLGHVCSAGDGLGDWMVVISTRPSRGIAIFLQVGHVGSCPLRLNCSRACFDLNQPLMHSARY